MLEQTSALASENLGFDEMRVILRDEFDQRRSYDQQ
jgi:hypothetical protein